MMLHKVSARRDRRTSDRTVYSKQFDKLFTMWAMAELTAQTQQPFRDSDAKENRLDKGKGQLGKDWVWSGCSHLPVKRSDFCEITIVPVSRDLSSRRWPWLWAHPGCRPPGDYRVQVCWRSSHLSSRRSDLRKMFTDGRRDRQTDGRTTDTAQ